MIKNMNGAETIKTHNIIGFIPRFWEVNLNVQQNFLDSRVPIFNARAAQIIFKPGLLSSRSTEKNICSCTSAGQS